MNIIEIDNLLIPGNKIPIADVRSEGEFQQGHIPGSINIPLLNNDERKQVGICYKEKGSEAAVILGYELVGGKFAEMIKRYKILFPTRKIFLHCWRGGLRSKIVYQILENAGFEIVVLKGGYKSYRYWVLEVLDAPVFLKVIGGLTGSGKTELLQMLLKHGEQVIDLEALASHRGSAFGGVEQPVQPTQEQFENNLAEVIYKFDTSKNIWIEDESRMIGNKSIPPKLWDSIRNSSLYEIEVPYAQRIDRILKEYSLLPKEKLKEKTITLKKRLGDKNLKEILQFLDQRDMESWVSGLLKYYDKNYKYGQDSRAASSISKIIFPDKLNLEEFLKSVNAIKDKKGPKPLNEQKL